MPVQTQAQKIIDLAAGEVGYHEGRSGSNWNNHQKYSPAVPGLEWSQNQAWCATFMSWLALKSGLAALYPRTASCDVAGNWFKQRGRWSEYPAVGAQAFFGTKRDLSHTGLVVDYDETYVYTIEGNTNTSGSRQGDGVYKQKRRRRDANVVGYGYPKFTAGIKTADPDPKWKKAVTPPKPPSKPDKPATKPPKVQPSTGKLPTDAVDGSHWNEFTVEGMKLAAKDGVEYYWFKATEGIDFVDENYKANRATATKAGKKSSGYHFARPRVSDGATQARFFLAHAGIKPGTDLEMMLDLEDDGGKSRAELTKWVGSFMKVIFDHLGPHAVIYTNFNLDKNFGCHLWVARYHPENALPKVPEPWKSQGKLWDVRQFANGVIGNPHTVRGLKKVDLNNIVGDPKRLYLPKKPGAPKPKPVPVPATPKNAVDFRVHLVPGEKSQSAASIHTDMALVKKISGRSALVTQTERESTTTRGACKDGLGKGWGQVHANENVVNYGPAWKVNGTPTQLLLNPKDPHLEHVSGNRYLNTTPLTHEKLKALVLALKNTHLLSEANCKHIHVPGRKWREKNWPVQLHDVIADCVKTWDNGNGQPQVLVGDFNTGIKFTGKQVFALLKKEFGDNVHHVHNGGLDQMFIISTKKVKLSELGKEKVRNNQSNHDMVTATIRATVL